MQVSHFSANALQDFSGSDVNVRCQCFKTCNLTKPKFFKIYTWFRKIVQVSEKAGKIVSNSFLLKRKVPVYIAILLKSNIIYRFSQGKSEVLDNHSLFKQNMEPCNAKGDVTRDNSQRRFLLQHSVATLLRHCFEYLQHCSNIATLCCAKIIIANLLM